MEGIKVWIRGDGVESSIEFSIEEVVAQHRGKPWRDLSDEEREMVLKDYAKALFTRQGGAGTAEDIEVSFDQATFSSDRSLPRQEGTRPPT